MHQFRDKSAAQRELVSAGLLFYPVLQAADVLAYRAHEVPVGEDQREHLELMRDTAERFNKRFGELLVVPEHRIPDGRRARARPAGARAQDVDDRRHRAGHASTCSTSPTTIRRKFKRAVADSGREIVRAEDKPGISNLIEIMAAARGIAPEEIEREFEGSGYGDFKAAVAEAVIEWLDAGARALRRAARRRGRARGHPRGGRRQGPRDRRATRWRTCARRWASAPSAVRRARRLAFGSAWPRSRTASSWTSTSSRGRSTCCSR